MTDPTRHSDTEATLKHHRDAVRFDGIQKSFGGAHALRDVSFAVRPGTVHGLLGANGSGKSTLIKILAGVESADDGHISVHGHPPLDARRSNPSWARQVGLHFVHQSVGTFPELTVADNFALGSGYGRAALLPIPRRELDSRVARVLAQFEIDASPRVPMGALSAATQTMIAVARALEDRATDSSAILVLDEPTASMPAHEVETVLNAMRARTVVGQTVIFVSHRLDEVLDVATDVTFLVNGEHRETRSRSGLTRQQLITGITGADQEATQGPRGHHPEPGSSDHHPGLAVHNLSIRGLSNVNLKVRPGEIVGIAGLLGSGRTTLLKSIFGAYPVSTGSIALNDRPLRLRRPKDAMRAGIALVPEDRLGEAAFLDQDLGFNYCIRNPRRFWRRGWLSARRERAAARRMLARHAVVAGSTSATMSSLSGGNQQKVVIARWLDEHPAVLLLDEPTQGVDIGARTAIHDLIRDAAGQGTAVLVASSDARELVDLCDRVVGLVNGSVRGELIGSAITSERCVELAFPAPEEPPAPAHAGGTT